MMLSWLAEKSYARQVRNKIYSELSDLHGPSVARDCELVAEQAVRTAQKLDGFPRDMLSRYRRAGLSVSDAALAYLDSSVTAIKRLSLCIERPASVHEALAHMEPALDRMFLKNPGKIVPNNGSMAEHLSDFTKAVEF